jgi:ER-bound oxygenase mpaB/B'/Rubber oxygenase, catalytic domain
MRRNASLLRIRRLDPERDYHQIYRTLALVEFPWDMRMALQLAFLRTFAVPSISGLLDRAGQITHHAHKRALDTALLMFELIDHGFAHPRGRDAVRRLNRIHQRYDIGNHDYLYVLGTLVIGPTRWLERYGWRPVCCHERTATYVFYRELGRRMGIRDIPPSYEAFQAFIDAFEQQRFRRTEAGQRLMKANRGLFVGRFSGPLAPVAGGLADALLDEPFRQAVGVGPAPWPIRAALLVGLKIRARVLRLLPPQPERAATDAVRYGIRTSAVYPDGYEISELGPP